MSLPLATFGPLTPAEDRLIRHLQARDRRTCEIGPTVPATDTPAVRLRASLVRELALAQVEGVPLPETGLRVKGAWIAGDEAEGAGNRGLDLEGCTLPGDLALFACRFSDPILLRSAKARSVFLNESTLDAGIAADGLQADGRVFLRRVTATGEVRLLGARLGDLLDCTGATFTVAGGDALSADGLQTEGGVFLRGVTATGEVRLLGARLGGDLECTNAAFTAQGGDALSADRLQAKGSMFLRGVKATGTVRLPNARLLGTLDCVGGTFTAQGDNALMFDGLYVEGDVFLSSATALGDVNLRGSRLGGQLACEGATFTAGRGSALLLDGARITGALLLRGGAVVKGPVTLTAAEIGVMVDDPACWPARGNLILDRCQYGAFGGEAPVDAESRIRWLALQEPALYGLEFWPQPYEECARVLREGGHAGAARAVLIEKERLQRAAKRARIRRTDVNFGTPRAAWRWVVDEVLLGLTIAYGRVPMRAFLWLAGLWLAGTGVFAGAEAAGALKPNLPQVQRAPEWVLCGVDAGQPVAGASLRDGATGLRDPGETQYACFLRQPEAQSYPRFSAAIYSADALFPVVNLEMQSYWLPDETVPGGWARGYLWLHIALGWGLTLLAVAGFSGLVKQDSK